VTASGTPDDAMPGGIEVAQRVEANHLTEGEKTIEADATSGARDEPEPGDTDESAEAAGSTTDATAGAPTGAANGDKRGVSWTRMLAFGLLPGLALMIAMATGFLKWQDSSVRDAQTARLEAMQVAKDSTIALLSYQPDTAEKDLGAARDRLTGSFRDSYTALTHDVVIPGAKQKQISAVVNVPAVASVSASTDHAVVLVFVNQTIIVGTDAPSATASSVKVSLDKIGGRWLISDFTPV
jgi:Mce-associated membrane protein